MFSSAQTTQARIEFERKLEILLNTFRYSNRPRVKADVSNVLSNFKSLTAKDGFLTHNDGTESKLLVLTGTIPIVFKGNTYNIPIDMYIPETHPVVSPKVYVRPTANMIVHSYHPHVDIEGLVRVPYLSSWSSSSSLLDLIHILCSVFSNEPPLYTKRPGIQSTNNIINTATTTTNSINNNNNNNSNINNRSVQGNVLAINNNNSSNNLSRRQQLIEDVTKKLQGELLNYYVRLNSEVNNEFRTQFDLKISQDETTQIISDLKKQKESLAKAVEEFSTLSSRLDRWIEEKEKTRNNTNIDSCLEAYDPVSDQLVRLHAEQLAIEDTLYKLDNGIASDKKHATLTLDAFIQQTRKLARQHFFTKSHVEKINNKIAIMNMNN